MDAVTRDCAAAIAVERPVLRARASPPTPVTDSALVAAAFTSVGLRRRQVGFGGAQDILRILRFDARYELAGRNAVANRHAAIDEASPPMRKARLVLVFAPGPAR